MLTVGPISFGEDAAEEDKPKSLVGNYEISSSLEFAGVRWSSLEFAGVRWSSLEFAGVRWSSLEFAGVRWSRLEFTGVRRSTLQFAGVLRSSLEYVGVHGTVCATANARLVYFKLKAAPL